MSRGKGKYFWAALVLALALNAAGCGSAPVSKAPEAPGEKASAQKQTLASGSEFETLRQEADKFLKREKPFFINASEVYNKVVLAADQSYLVVDVRNPDHFAKANIPGSINIPFADTWRANKVELLPKDKKLVVVDYSGHSAAQVATLWGMLGYDTVAMHNGMAGWSNKNDIIGGSSLACTPLGYPIVSEAAQAKAFELPKLAQEKPVTAGQLMMKQMEKFIADKKEVILKPEDVKTKVVDGAEASKYFLVDLRKPEHYSAGHIAGAINIPIKGIADGENLKKLPADKKLVLVDYDGHEASIAVRVLNQLGYDATAMKNGMSAWTSNENAAGIKLIACGVKELPTVKLNARLGNVAGGAAT